MTPLRVGDEVIVKIYRRWRHGRVVRVGRSNVEVEYSTPHGVTTTKTATFRIVDVRTPEARP